MRESSVVYIALFGVVILIFFISGLFGLEQFGPDYIKPDGDGSIGQIVTGTQDPSKDSLQIGFLPVATVRPTTPPPPTSSPGVTTPPGVTIQPITTNAPTPGSTGQTCESHGRKYPTCDCLATQEVITYCTFDQTTCKQKRGIWIPGIAIDWETNNPVPGSDCLFLSQERQREVENEPQCNQYCMGKPVIYLYPLVKTLVDVLIHTSGEIIVSDPLYPEGGWKKCTRTSRWITRV